MVYSFNTRRIPVVTYMNRCSTPPNYKHFMRTAEEFIFYFIHDGCMYLTEDGIKYELHAGDAILLQPGLTHMGYRESFCAFSYIHFAPATFQTLEIEGCEAVAQALADNRNMLYTCNPFAGEFYDKVALYIPKHLHVAEPSRAVQIEQCMDAAIRAFDMKNIHFKLLCSCKAIEIMALVAASFSDQRLHGAGREKPVSQNCKTVNELLNMLHAEYAEKLTGDSIAHRMGLNFDYLNRIFKRQIGMTIFAYVNILRINKAKELLVNGNLKLHDIATKVGFCDEYRFSKAFRQAVGTTPRRFR